MYNSPHEEESLPRVLPGKLLSLDAQCRKDRGTSACFKDDRVCAQLFCFDAGSGYCVSYRPAAEGSRCGDNQVLPPSPRSQPNPRRIPDVPERPVRVGPRERHRLWRRQLPATHRHSCQQDLLEGGQHHGEVCPGYPATV